jgi:hypothetical protein
MFGTVEDPGLIPLTMRELFRRLDVDVDLVCIMYNGRSLSQ